MNISDAIVNFVLNTSLMSYTICYTSKSVQDLNLEEIESIFKSTIVKNNARNITGILLYNSGCFFQVLEGEKSIVKELFYDIIYPDKRHRELFVVMEKFTEKPFFSLYNTQFSVVKTLQEYNHLKKYIDANFVNKDTEKFKRLLSPFVQMLDD